MEIDHKNPSPPPYWKKACRYLSVCDPVMAKLIKQYKGESLARKNNAFHTLIRAIVGQQISVKAADSIWKRLDTLLENNMRPENAIKATVEQLRSIGLSQQKVNYFINVVEFFIHEMKGETDLIDHDHIMIGEKLIEIKGIGQWTVDMFMMFHMHSPDILPIGDLGLINAMRKLYGLDEKIAKKNKKSSDEKKQKAADKKELMRLIFEISDNWRPYRTVATWYLWRYLDPVPVEY